MTSLSGIFKHSENLPRIIELDLGSIVANPEQPRRTFDPDRLAELAGSIDARGLIHPVTVKSLGDAKYMIVAGERRFRAFGLLKRQTIPAIVSNGDIDELALIENVQRENLHPVDEYEAVARLTNKHGYTHEEVAKILGKGRVTITELLSLSSIPESLRQQAREDEAISKSFLVELAREKDPQKQVMLWTSSRAAGTVRAARSARKATAPAAARGPLLVAKQVGRRFVRAVSAISVADTSNAPALQDLANRLLIALDEASAVDKTTPASGRQ